MSSINALVGVIQTAVRIKSDKARIVPGQYNKGDVVVGNTGYRPHNAGDTGPVTGKPVYCLIQGTNCYVISDV